MTARQYFTLGLLAILPLAASAQQTTQGTSHPHSPLDAGTAVSAPAYVSAFKDYQSAPDEQAAPDKVWRRANEAVGKPGSHAGHIGENAAMVPTVKPKATAEAARPSSPRMPMTMQHGHHHHE